MSWVCPIVGGAPMPPWHIALHLGLAAFVIVAGSVFLALAIRAYRRPLEPPLEALDSSATDRTPAAQPGATSSMRIRLLIRPFDS